MDLEERYQLLEKLGSGSFATVYRARDLELGREVAIREIHGEYLERPEQLERYWQEAQLLASLQHPNIVTIFDIYRSRGWVILELMQASLKSRMSGRQMDLRSLRTTLAHCLRALKYLHAQGIVHGDIRPGNLMLDARRRVKLGDFGLARRASDSEGELIKGDTKYMSPETVSDEFGDVGPASDLYSLGFTAYELMCGENFDTLFPGLSAFGSNPQIAWMMWHAAPDRRLPEIPRVLEGVPADLVRVIQKLCEKDQSKRYKTADEALSDLDIDANFASAKGVAGEGPRDEAAEEDEQPAGDKKRLLIVAGMFGVSLVLSLVMLLMPSGDKTPVQQTTDRRVGVVRDNLADEKKLIVLDAETGAAQELDFGGATAPIIYFRNEDQNILLREIQAGDRVIVEPPEGDGAAGQWRLTVDRPKVSHGRLAERDTQERRITIALEEGTERGELSLRVPDRARVKINSSNKTLVDLEPGDRVQVRHFPEVGDRPGRVVDELVALRPEELTGYVAAIIEGEPTELKISFGRNLSAGPPLQLPLGDDVEFRLQTPSGTLQKIALADLQVDDRVKVQYDIAFRSVIVTREKQHAEGVINSVDGETLAVTQSDGTMLELSWSPQCEVTVNLEAAAADDLRRFDTVKVSYDTVDESAVALAVDAKRPVRHNRWAILIANETFNDRGITPTPHAVRNARLLRESLLKRYAFAADRVLLLVDQPRDEILKQVTEYLKLVPADAQLLVYLSGNGYRADDGTLVLAAADSNLKRLGDSGVPLAQLAAEVEGCASKDKLLLLDTYRGGTEPDGSRQPSTAAVLETLQPSLGTTAAIASCSEGERPADHPTRQAGLFVHCLAEGFSGDADTDRDLHVTPTELFEFVRGCLPKNAPANTTQTPVLHEPSAES